MRTAKQLKADLRKINLENKSVRQAQKTVLKQYEKLGRKAPSKLINGVATLRDMNNYMTTLNNAVDRKLMKELKDKGDSIGLLMELNSIQEKRANIIRKHLKGYDSYLVEETLKGSTISLGRGITTNVTPTTQYELEKVEKIAEFNNKTVEEWLKTKIGTMKRDLKDMRNIDKTDVNGFMSSIEKLLQIDEGYQLTEHNKRVLQNKIKSLDMFGREKLLQILYTKQDNLFYEIYKEDLELNRNSDLMKSLVNDINKSLPNRLQEKARVI